MSNPTPLFPRTIDGLQGMSWMAEVELNHLIRLGSLKSNLLEIGTASGVTASAISRANPHLNVICVDDFGTSANEYDKNRFENWKANATPRMRLINIDARSLHKAIPTHNRFDLIIIDGDHGYEGCLRDLESIVPYCLSYRTTVTCHDYGDRNHDGVRKAVHEFLHRYSAFRFVSIQHSLLELLYEAPTP